MQIHTKFFRKAKWEINEVKSSEGAITFLSSSRSSLLSMLTNLSTFPSTKNLSQQGAKGHIQTRLQVRGPIREGGVPDKLAARFLVANRS